MKVALVSDLNVEYNDKLTWNIILDSWELGLSCGTKGTLPPWPVSQNYNSLLLISVALQPSVWISRVKNKSTLTTFVSLHHEWLFVVINSINLLFKASFIFCAKVVELLWCSGLKALWLKIF